MEHIIKVHLCSPLNRIHILVGCYEMFQKSGIHLYVGDLPEGHPDAKKTQRLTGLESAGQLATASVFLTSLHPDKFVDFRQTRWEKLAKQIRIEEEFAPVINCSKEKRLEEVGKFAKMITETPTFKKYWGNQQEPLWTLAGICWRVKGDKPEGGDTNMDELVEKILQMEILMELIQVLFLLEVIQQGLLLHYI